MNPSCQHVNSFLLFLDFCNCTIQLTFNHAKHNIRKMFNHFKVNRNMIY